MIKNENCHFFGPFSAPVGALTPGSLLDQLILLIYVQVLPFSPRCVATGTFTDAALPPAILQLTASVKTPYKDKTALL